MGDTRRILFMTDPHNSDTPPLRRTKSYRDDILAKQEFIIPYAKKCDFTVIGGDVYHQKNPNRISHYLVNRIAEIYREYGQLFIVPGNHDIDNSIDELKYNPLATLAKLPNVSLRLNCSSVVGGINMFWWGLGEFLAKEEMFKCLAQWQAERDKDTGSYVLPTVAVMHSAITTKKYPFDIIPFEKVEPFADFFMLGHLHDFQAVDSRFVAPGALSRGVLKFDSSFNRSVGFVIVTVPITGNTAPITVEPVCVPVREAEEIFDIEKKISEQEVELQLGQFAEIIKDFELEKNPIDKESLIEHIKLMEIDEVVKKYAIELLKEVETL